jgi:very-short-patch-repair endonuclease
VFEQIQKIFLDTQRGVYIDGFEMDIFIPSLSLNIEVDGRYHRGNKLGRDKKRDAYLQSKNIKTLRFSYTPDLLVNGTQDFINMIILNNNS